MTRGVALLARYAEGLFWMARYLERVENMARLVDVTQNFESPGREAEAWYALVRINADEAPFADRGLFGEPEAVKRFYVLDATNPTSITASIEAARTNARTLRPLISTEMWMQMNVFHRDILAISEDELQADRLSRLCRRIKEGVQAHTGITEGTFFRDEGWHFYQLGRLLERADQTTRLLDIKYHQLMPSGIEERRVLELTQWSVVLRACAGYHAFRRVAPAGFAPRDVVRFLIGDPSFPRSVTLCVTELEWHLTQLRRHYGLRGTVGALERVEELRGALTDRAVEQLIAEGLHEFLDRVQRDLIRLGNEIGTAFFRDWRPLATQSQSMGPDMTQSQGAGGRTMRMGDLTLSMPPLEPEP
ncbi:MAG: alpha-E domain-containing protein [Acidisphaera sp.]|nr:alpha-E domain-containing protein [Acidisphaera sp.]